MSKRYFPTVMFMTINKKPEDFYVHVSETTAIWDHKKKKERKEKENWCKFFFYFSCKVAEKKTYKFLGGGNKALKMVKVAAVIAGKKLCASVQQQQLCHFLQGHFSFFLMLRQHAYQPEHLVLSTCQIYVLFLFLALKQPTHRKEQMLKLERLKKRSVSLACTQPLHY